MIYHCTDWDHEDQRNTAICLKTHSFAIQCYSWIAAGVGGWTETRITAEVGWWWGDTDLQRRNVGPSRLLKGILHKGRGERNPSSLQGALSPPGRCSQDGSLSVAGSDFSAPSIFTSTHRCPHPTASTTAGLQPDRSHDGMTGRAWRCAALWVREGKGFPKTRQPNR